MQGKKVGSQKVSEEVWSSVNSKSFKVNKIRPNFTSSCNTVQYCSCIQKWNEIKLNAVLQKVSQSFKSLKLNLHLHVKSGKK